MGLRLLSGHLVQFDHSYRYHLSEPPWIWMWYGPVTWPRAPRPYQFWLVPEEELEFRQQMKKTGLIHNIVHLNKTMSGDFFVGLLTLPKSPDMVLLRWTMLSISPVFFICCWTRHLPILFPKQPVGWAALCIACVQWREAKQTGADWREVSRHFDRAVVWFLHRSGCVPAWW